MSLDVISYSRIREWLNCRFRYNMSYNMNLTSRKDFEAPTLGSAGHAGVAAGILGQNPDEELEKWAKDYLKKHLTPEDKLDDFGMAESINNMIQQSIDEVIHTASLLVPRALDFLNLDEWETVMFKGQPLVEATFIIPIRGWKGYKAIMDWVAIHKPTGAIWLHDHKFRRQLQPTESEEVNLQMPSYQKILHRNGIDTVGSIANQFLMKLPSEPSLNKNNTMSRQRIATDWATYEACLLRAGLNPADYIEEMKPKLDVEFYRQSMAYRNRVEVDNTWSDIIQRTAWDMSRKNPHITRNMGIMNCKGCWAKEYCLESLRGGDLDYIVATQYMPKHRQEDAEIDEVEGGEN